MQNFSVMAEARKGFARRGPSGLWRRGFARVPNIDAEGLRMETEITRDRYSYGPTFYRTGDRSIRRVF